MKLMKFSAKPGQNSKNQQQANFGGDQKLTQYKRTRQDKEEGAGGGGGGGAASVPHSTFIHARIRTHKEVHLNWHSQKNI